MSTLSLEDPSTLYLTLQGAYLRMRDSRIEVHQDEELVGKVLMKDLQRICIFGQILISNQLMTECLDRGIIIFHFTKYGRYRGSTYGNEVKSYHVQEAQLKFQNPLPLVRELINAQITSRLSILSKKLSERFTELRELQNKVREASSISSLRGYEGMASKIYWSTFPKLLSEPSLFNGRTRRPPRDEANAILSFTYTLLGTELETHIRYYGLNPYKGYLHEYRYGRKSLQLDILEQFRPAAEIMTLSLLNRKIMNDKHFEREAVSVLLNDKGRKIFLREYENFLRRKFKTESGTMSLRNIAQIQVQKLVSTITEGKDYSGFTILK